LRAGDTIIALSSGGLPSGVAVIRLSGPAVRDSLLEVIGTLPKPRQLTLADIRKDGDTLDRGLVVFFPGPRSFTGEDCAELQVHGSAAVVRAILRTFTATLGVRLAEAGEFTRRAFENGKLDLTEVEGLGDLILAETESQRRQAFARLAGGLSEMIGTWRERLLDLRAEIEARLDFSDEADVSSELPAEFAEGVIALRRDVDTAIASVSQGRIVREGLRVALAGPPNVGKSSLLNALARSDIAIVTDEPGTTRDVREVAIDVGGQLVVLLDMAGLRDTRSIAEAEGVRRARQEIARADLVLWLSAPDVPSLPLTEINDTPVWRVASKADLGVVASDGLAVSAATGLGMAELISRLTDFVTSAAGSGEPSLLSRERDRSALIAASAALDDAVSNLADAELAAENLRQASFALERLLGRMDAEAVLDRLFSAFCIGK
jgi:tRNA modification GTPase